MRIFKCKGNVIVNIKFFFRFTELPYCKSSKYHFFSHRITRKYFTRKKQHKQLTSYIAQISEKDGSSILHHLPLKKIFKRICSVNLELCYIPHQLITQIELATTFKKNYLMIWNENRKPQIQWIVLLILEVKYNLCLRTNFSEESRFHHFMIHSNISEWHQHHLSHN